MGEVLDFVTWRAFHACFSAVAFYGSFFSPHVSACTHPVAANSPSSHLSCCLSPTLSDSPTSSRSQFQKTILIWSVVQTALGYPPVTRLATHHPTGQTACIHRHLDGVGDDSDVAFAVGCYCTPITELGCLRSRRWPRPFVGASEEYRKYRESNQKTE